MPYQVGVARKNIQNISTEEMNIPGGMETTNNLPVVPTRTEEKDKFSVGKMIGNIPSSGAEFVKSIGTAIAHPIETTKSLGRVGLGAVEKLIPGEQRHEQSFNQIKDFYVGRYGNMDNFLKALENDPIGVASDLSVVLGGAGAALKAPALGGKIATLGKIGGVASKGAAITEPLTLTGKTLKTIGILPKRMIGRVGSESLGVTTGAGGEAIRTAYQSAKAGSREFGTSLRGRISQADVLNYAKEGLNKIKSQRGAEYSARLSKIKEANKLLNFDPIKIKIAETLNKFNISIKNGKFNFSKSAIADTAEQRRIANLMNEALKWKDNSVIGLDTLKRRLDDFTTTSREGLALKTSVANSVKNLVIKSTPGYQKMISEYQKASILINELESTLSLKVGANIDTALTKLASTLRRDATFRRELLQKLDLATKQDVAGQVAGALLNPFVPSGLIGRSIFGGGPVAAILTGTFSPTLFSSLLFASPRIVGEFVNALGISARYGENIMKFLEKTSGIRRTTTQSLFQLGRLKKKEEE